MIILVTENCPGAKTKKRKILTTLTTSIFGLFILVLPVMNCQAFEGHAKSTDGKLAVTYRVQEGYKITIRIDTKSKKGAYLENPKGDVSAIKVDFIDVNRDGLQDVIIKFADETGYSPSVLVNHGDLSFTDALTDIKKKEPLYINTEPEVILGGGDTPRSGYKVKNRGDVPELICYNVFIGDKGYRYAAFRYDKQTASYVLYKKGELFEEH
jgi:hypothetical protein